GTTPVSSSASFKADTYTLGETGPGGYTRSAWSCTNGVTVTGNQITLANGQSTTCTIHNDDNAPSLTLNKVVVNDNGGTALNTDWTLSATGPTTISGTTPVASDGTFSAGTYT